jgi:poly(3-hydroxybutyrate) depolymerase
MALVLAATYPDLYAAVGVHSAPAYRSASSGTDAMAAMAGRTRIRPPGPDIAGDGLPRGMPPAVVFQGSLDNAVHASNGRRVAEQWLAFHEMRTPGRKHPDRVTRHRTTNGRHGGRSYTATHWYTARGHKVLEYWQVDGLGHAWSGGASGGSYSDPRGPRATTAMWHFLSSKRLHPDG